MELELDSGEFLNKNPEELIGEQLLVSDYAVNQNQSNDFKFRFNNKNANNNNNKNENEFLNGAGGPNSTTANIENLINTRPITPHHLRQSQLIQSKQFTSSSHNQTNLNNSRPPAVVKLSGQSGNSYIRQKSNGNNNNSIGTVKDSSISRQSFSLKNSRSQSSDRNKNSVTLVSKLDNNDTRMFENEQNSQKGADILVIDSIAEPSYQVPQAEQTKYVYVNDSVSGFVAKPKIQRTPDQSMMIVSSNKQQNNKQNGVPLPYTSISSVNSFAPKYSISEPRPSSANSLKNSSN
jgi:hypothetical protein